MSSVKAARALARYQQLLERADFDLKLAADAALAAALPFARLMRIKRARRELNDELCALRKINEQEKQPAS